MKRAFSNLGGFLAVVWAAGALGAPPAQKGATEAYGPKEKAVLDELNLARTQPQKYAVFLEEFRKDFHTDKSFRRHGVNMITKEGVAAVDEAIAFLKKQKPIGAMTLSRGLSQAARDHASDIGPKGVVGHAGSDKSQPADRMNRHGKFRRTAGENIAFGPDEARQIVMQLIVDDGVPSRGHRQNIFQDAFRTVGIAIGPHKTFRNVCVMDFADSFQDK